MSMPMQMQLPNLPQAPAPVQQTQPTQTFPLDINEQVVQALLELNKELICVCIDYQNNRLTMDPGFLQ
ncbi:hypothetical protein BGZ82_003327 [Podila clonocystis]|nr:hypothetical protein BGZ82_003327 [Podila clonocystis]